MILSSLPSTVRRVDEPARSDRLIIAIGIFKLVKTAFLLAAGIGALTVVPEHVARWIARVGFWMGGAPGHRVLRHLAERVLFAQQSRMREVGILAIGYAMIFLVEGTCILRRKTWAEWLTAIVTASFIPLEIYEIVVHVNAGRIVALLINVAIAAYLFGRRLRARRAHTG
ncbi:MAG TPA: DUF2127 domain-containing protein [Polyangia bacterium]|nr:DUF2127 domain-containing protein [Polyangia bacterium]